MCFILSGCDSAPVQVYNYIKIYILMFTLITSQESFNTELTWSWPSTTETLWLTLEEHVHPTRNTSILSLCSSWSHAASEHGAKPTCRTRDVLRSDQTESVQTVSCPDDSRQESFTHTLCNHSCSCKHTHADASIKELREELKSFYSKTSTPEAHLCSHVTAAALSCCFRVEGLQSGCDI